MPYPRPLKRNPDFSRDDYIQITPENAGWEHLYFSARKIGKDKSWVSETGDTEMVVVILGGTAEFQSNRKSWRKIGRRLDVFSGMPYAVYIPRETKFELRAISEELDIGYGWTKTDEDHPIQLITPEMVSIEIRGGGNVTRQINSIIPPGFDCHKLVVVEVYTPSGNWSSYPPHKHDRHQVDEDGNLIEADLEEIYFYKIDKPNAQPKKAINQLMEHGIIPEQLGGDTLTVEISALKGEGIDELLEAILLQAEVMELKARYNVPARGVIIETRIPKGEGPQGTVIIKEGRLRVGDNFVAGITYGRVKRMKNEWGEQLKEALPSVPVEVLGFQDLPKAGDLLEVVKNERTAKKIVEERVRESKKPSPTPVYSIEELKRRMEAEKVKEINLIIKGDTQGSVEALKSSLVKLEEKEVKVKFIHEGIGNINRSDVLLASTTGSIIIGFQVGKESQVDSLAKGHGVDIRLYKVIYEAIDDVGRLIKSLVTPEIEEVKIGEAEIRRIFEIPRLGKIAGCYVLQGRVKRGRRFEIKRGEKIVGEGIISSLRRFKEDVKEVREGYECGIGLSNFEDFQEGDKIIVYEEREKQ